jgi:hypothetical protein
MTPRAPRRNRLERLRWLAEDWLAPTIALVALVGLLLALLVWP